MCIIRFREELYQLKKGLKQKRERIKQWWFVYYPIGPKAFLVGTPEHANIGDSAIALAEKKFINQTLGKRFVLKEITEKEYTKYKRFLLKPPFHSKFFFAMGGGNMGDVWFKEELLRRDIISENRKINLIIFPQTIHYTATPRGVEEKEKSIEYYNHPEITIVAREKKSFEILTSLYPKANLLLTPDIVLSSTKKDYLSNSEKKREGVLLCIRNDVEKSINNSIWNEIEYFLQKQNLKTTKTDMMADYGATKDNREEIVRKKLQEFCHAELVITDRLHGMVFSALAETPCIVFSNYNHKVTGTYDWISYLPYVQYVETAEEAKQAIPKLLSMKDCYFDNAPLKPYFEKLAEDIKTRCQ